MMAQFSNLIDSDFIAQPEILIASIKIIYDIY